SPTPALGCSATGPGVKQTAPKLGHGRYSQREKRAPRALSCASVTDAHGFGAHHGLDAIAHAHFAEHARQIVLDGPGVEAEPVGDLLVGEAFGEVAQHLLIPCREYEFLVLGGPEGLALIAQEQAGGECWSDVGLALIDAFERDHELVS